MVKINKIYTRTGDDGTTGLVVGDRRLKNDARIEAYGVVDECNSIIGIARLHTSGDLDAMLKRIQNEMFDLGADLATPEGDYSWEPLRIVASQATRLEAEIDLLNKDMQPLTSFILPAGTPASTYLHLARTVARRAERVMVTLAQTEAISPDCLKYINRLSDFLFCAARFCNKEAGDILWIPGGTR
jgi:cob(I)alamin adenosyltransferase